MNREIKFRVWDYERKDFLHNILEDYDIIYTDNKWYIHGGKELDNRFRMLQFTGLKDKNDVLIYEGDIVSYSKLNHEIHWNDYKWIAICPNYSEYHYPTFDLSYNASKCSEVVGNIFKNKELVK